MRISKYGTIATKYKAGFPEIAAVKIVHASKGLSIVFYLDKKKLNVIKAGTVENQIHCCLILYFSFYIVDELFTIAKS